MSVYLSDTGSTSNITNSNTSSNHNTNTYIDNRTRPPDLRQVPLGGLLRPGEGDGPEGNILQCMFQHDIA